MPPRGRLFLIDGSALAYRSYFAFVRNPLINSRGENTSAPFAFTNTLLKILREERPEYIVVVFDTSKPTFRHAKFPAYKATRQKMPSDMKEQLPRIYQIIEAMRLPVIEQEGFEADDVIGTLARKAAEQGIKTILVTGDKDFTQLVSPLIKMLNPKRSGDEFELIDQDAVRTKFGVDPEKVVDVLALMGDSSDNVPGVPNVGGKTAAALVKQFGGLEAVLKNAHRINKPRIRKNLTDFAQQARLSKELVVIDTNVPVDLNLERFRFQGFDNERLIEIFKELEFNRFLRELSPASSREEVSYSTVKTVEQLERLVEKIKSKKRAVVNLATTDPNPMQASLVGVSVALVPRQAFYIPVAHSRGENLPLKVVLSALKPVLEDEGIQKYGQDIKYSTAVLIRNGVVPRGFLFDTMIAAYLLDPSTHQHNLDLLSLKYLNHKIDSLTDLIGKGQKQISFAQIPIERATLYCCENADVALRLKEIFEPKLVQLGLMDLFQGVEIPLVEVLRQMELNGVSVDTAFLDQMSRELQERLDGLMAEIYHEAGEEFNINSPRQLAHILFDKLGLPSRKRTKTGYSTDMGVLEELARKYELPRRLLEYRQLVKLKSTYVDALPRLVNPETGRIHTSFNQTATATGRLSSSDPNLQNIPVRTEIGRKIRRAFVTADSQHLFLDADYSQIELRIMAHISGDSNLIEAFQNDEDIHLRTAALSFGLPPEYITPDLRRQAKVINFGIMYGMGPYGLAEQLGISPQEAKEFIESYFRVYPGVKDYIEQTIRKARETGYVTTLLGRRRYLPDINSSNSRVREFAERTAVNTPIQGTAADLIKIAMINIHRRLNQAGMQTKMILQVHDELAFEVPKKELHEARELIAQEMEQALKLSVPIKVDIGVGNNWLEAH
ncbi:MAG: DNA polymerase I [Candidatus Latescibacterota bacterium]|nr:MAG: DNA polymerase I [Candidatus Latescibacterota bacterium]